MDIESKLNQIRKFIDNSNYIKANSIISELNDNSNLDLDDSGFLYYFAGLVSIHEKEYLKAEENLTKSLELRLIANETESDLIKIVETFYQLGIVYYKKGNLQKSIDASLEALMMENSLFSQAELMGNIYYVLAKSSHKQSYLTKANIYYEEAFHYFKTLEVPYLRTNVLLSHGILFLNYGDNQKAIKTYYKALWIAKRHKYNKLIAKAILHITEAYFTSEDMENISLNKPLAYEMESFQPNDPLVYIVKQSISAMNFHLVKDLRKAKNYWNSILFSDLRIIDSRYFTNAYHKYKSYSVYKLWMNSLSENDAKQFNFCLSNWQDYCTEESLTNYLIENLIIHSKFNLILNNFDKMNEQLNFALNIAKINGLVPHENLVSNLLKNSERIIRDINTQDYVFSINLRRILQQEIETYFKNFYGVLILSV